MKRRVWNIPKTICLYSKFPNELVVPYGCKNDIWELHPHLKDWEIQLKNPVGLSYNSLIRLYDYQEQAVNACIKNQGGVIVMPCGSGKTQTALEIIARLGCKTLWLTHTTDLLTQSKKRAEVNYDIDSGCLGEITGGKINIGSHITFATVQTMVNIDLKDLEHEWQCVVVDECHKAIGAPTRVMMFYKVLSSLNARYKIGLTATPTRQDGLEQAMFSLIGAKVHEVDEDCVRENTVPIEVYTMPTGYVPLIDDITNTDGTINYTNAIKDLCKNKQRNEFISGEIGFHAWGGKKILVLTDRVFHAELLYDILVSDGFSVQTTTGRSKRRVRDETIEQMKDGDLDVLISTYALAKEGLDIPNLDMVVLATPKKDQTTVIQSVGRCSRKSEGKTHGEVLDFVDSFGMYKGMYNKRKRFYKKKGYKIHEIKEK